MKIKILSLWLLSSSLRRLLRSHAYIFKQDTNCIKNVNCNCTTCSSEIEFSRQRKVDLKCHDGTKELLVLITQCNCKESITLSKETQYFICASYAEFCFCICCYKSWLLL